MKQLFRRRSFHTPRYKEVKPKWHTLRTWESFIKERDEVPGMKAIRLTAWCGYEFEYLPAIYGAGGPMEWRDEIKTEQLRCRKCDTAYSKSREGDMVQP